MKRVDKYYFIDSIELIFYQEVKQSVINVITDNPGMEEIPLRKKITEIIEKYFDKTIGVKKMERMLSSRWYSNDPVMYLEKSKKRYLNLYQCYYELPRVNSRETLLKVASVADKVDKKVLEILRDEFKELNHMHFYCVMRKEVLLEDYGIVWYTPYECNFDFYDCLADPDSSYYFSPHRCSRIEGKMHT